MSKKVTPQNSLATIYPHLAAEWSPENEKTAHEVTSGSGYRALWICSKCQHPWRACVNNRSGCPACYGRAATDKNNFAVHHPDIALEWGVENALSPNEVTPGSNIRVSWKCRICDYGWKATVNHRTSGTGCPACAGRIVTVNNNLAVTHPHLAKEWSERNKHKADAITAGSNRKMLWVCLTCGHEWLAKVLNRTINKRGCPACSGRIATPQNNLAKTHPQLLLDWSPENTILPTEISFGSDKKVKWVCRVCEHKWQAIVGNRTYGKGCPRCAKYGYQVSRPGSLYIQEVCGGSVTFLKIGISNDPHRRMQQIAASSGLQHEFLAVYSFEDGNIPCGIETEIKQAFKNNGMGFAQLLGYAFDGVSETLPRTALAEVELIIQPYLTGTKNV